MDRNAVILITGAAGFIGSCLTGYLNRKGYYNIILVDDFSEDNKKHNFEEKKICARVDRDELFDWLSRYKIRIDFVFHLGAHTSESAKDTGSEKQNMDYAKQIWQYCTDKNISLVYASSYATYGPAENGYSDSMPPEKLNPANAPGVTKNEFDKWAVHQSHELKSPTFWAGLKFFTIYGPNEYHKGKFASPVFHSFQQASAAGKVELFKSGNKEYPHGEQRRDFVYVKDVVDVCYWLMQKSVEEDDRPVPGLYNVGTGKARTFNEMAKAVANSMNKQINIAYIEIPGNVQAGYSYSVEADMKKLVEAGYKKKFYSLEDGVKTYVQHFLLENKYY